VPDYELMYIVRPDLDEEALRAATESVATLVRGLGGEVSKTAMWGKRRLAYEIARLRDGHYVVCQIRLDGDRVSELERALKIHETVFRHLLVRREQAAGGAEGEATEGGLPSQAGADDDGAFAGEDRELTGEEDEVPAADTAEEDEE